MVGHGDEPERVTHWHPCYSLCCPVFSTSVRRYGSATGWLSCEHPGSGNSAPGHILRRLEVSKPVKNVRQGTRVLSCVPYRDCGQFVVFM